MLTTFLLIAGVLPWIGMIVDMNLHPWKPHGPYSKLGLFFLLPSIIIFIVVIASLLV
jgi:hypothetical protein